MAFNLPSFAGPQDDIDYLQEGTAKIKPKEQQEATSLSDREEHGIVAPSENDDLITVNIIDVDIRKALSAISMKQEINLSTAKGLRNYAMVNLAYWLGLRPVEISLIRLDDICFARDFKS